MNYMSLIQWKTHVSVCAHEFTDIFLCHCQSLSLIKRVSHTRSSVCVITTAEVRLCVLAVCLHVHRSVNSPRVYECVTQVSACVRVSLIVKSGGDAGLIKTDEERPMSWLG